MKNAFNSKLYHKCEDVAFFIPPDPSSITYKYQSNPSAYQTIKRYGGVEVKHKILHLGNRLCVSQVHALAVYQQRPRERWIPEPVCA
jgi:hypothetical protein